MATIGQTLFRFTGALLLGASAAAIDHPDFLFTRRSETLPVVAQQGPPQIGITPGKRAYAIRVDDVLAGMVKPNSRVDIIVVINDPEQQKQVAKLFMENMRVLAIGGAPERAKDGRPINVAVVSIEVTPTEAERLAIAASQGRLRVVLRGSGDADRSRPRGAGAIKQLMPPPPLVGQRDPCEGVNPRRATVRDLLNRGCRLDELRFKKDSVAIELVPPR